ncbi:MAG: hypothetical protein RPS47_04500 [Colwellia sp.]|jgi:hypothetical protein
MTDSKTKKTISEAQVRAHRKNDEKRKSMPCLPTARLSESEGAMAKELYAKFGTKKEAILKAIEFYLEHHK